MVQPVRADGSLLEKVEVSATSPLEAGRLATGLDLRRGSSGSRRLTLRAKVYSTGEAGVTTMNRYYLAD